jgi:hypothetical protein
MNWLILETEARHIQKRRMTQAADWERVRCLGSGHSRQRGSTRWQTIGAFWASTWRRMLLMGPTRVRPESGTLYRSP